MEKLETCAYKEIKYFNNCELCPGTEPRRCYVSHEEMFNHLRDFQLQFKPRIRQFYQRFGVDWKLRFMEKQC